MRLTRETLIKIARDAASQRARVSRRIICIYLTGSVLGDAPLLGGTTDVDLVVIEDSEPVEPREIVRMTDEVHLDIAHYSQALFHQPRHLRTDPWLGPFIYSKPLVLHDTQHWFDFTQAATGAQFFQPEYILQRAATLFQTARQTWLELEMNASDSHAQRIASYLAVLENAGNALASLGGPPIAERRFLLHLPHRLQELSMVSILPRMQHLLTGGFEGLEDAWPGWTRSWNESYLAAGKAEDCPARLHPCRLAYYERAAAALWEENENAALWMLLRTWSLAVKTAGETAVWQSAVQSLGLDEDRFAGRLAELDQYLDQIEEAMEGWGRANGASLNPES